jgi:Lipoprotein LpqB beta-propeller domain
LRALSEVTAVTITVNGIPLHDVPTIQDISSWQQWDPDGESSTDSAYYTDGGRVVGLVNDKAKDVLGQLGDGTFPLRDPGVSFDQSQIAGLDLHGHALYVSSLGAGHKVPPAVVTGADALTAPTWDRFGQVWTVDSRPTGSVVWVDKTATNGPATKVPTVGLPAGQVLAMRISRDGARLVVVVKSPGQSAGRLYIGRVEQDGEQMVLSGFRPITTVLTDTTDVSWISADRLLVLGRVGSGAALQPLSVELSGASEQSLGPIASTSGSGPVIESITAAPHQEVLASASDGLLYRYLAVGWDALGKGADPAYPG